jgi:GNAT superfamily N-acetyltransferase
VEVRSTVREIASPDDLDGLRPGDLSDWFNPFLEHFMLESLRCGGEVALAVEDSEIRGIYLYSPAERIASVFTRSRRIAEELARRRDRISIYAPFELAPSSEPYLIYSAGAEPWIDGGGFAHAVRLAQASDLPEVARLLRAVYGEVDERWIATMPHATERCFVVEVDGDMAGVAWASLAGGAGRLHSLSVRPRYRRLGIGTELFRARRLWLRAAGADPTISEIAERNLPSRRIAEAGGMRPVGRIFRVERPGPTVAPI